MSKKSCTIRAIQLFFDNNVESPLFDGESDVPSTDVETVELSGQKISKIIARCSHRISILSVEHENGT